MNLHGISVAGGVLIYVGISARYLMEFLATATVQSDVQGKVLIQIITKEILRMRSLVSTGY